jgi:alkylhydroperoxidase/carboxymuconolactone decarboxylase family protein YurZ
VSEPAIRDAWVELPTEAQIRAQTPPGATHPYDFGFVAGMMRLSRAHPTIGPAFGALFRQIMFEPGFLTRREREMVAAVTAAAQDCHY